VKERCDSLAGRLRLVAITDRRTIRGDLRPVVAALIEGGVSALILREKDLAPRALHELALPLCRMCHAGKVAFIVNGSLAVARSCGADGLHLGGEVPVAAMRTRWPQPKLLGVSAHCREDLVRAADAGADYALLAPIYPPNSKISARPALGPVAIEDWHELLPLIALGGVTPARMADCLRAGAIGVAAIGALFAAEDPAAAAAAFRRAGE